MGRVPEEGFPSRVPGPLPSQGSQLFPPLVPCSFPELLILVLPNLLAALLDYAPHAIPPFTRTLV